MMALRTFSALLMSVVTSSALSQDNKIVLRVADSFPANHYVVDYATKFWMDSVTKATGGAVTFQYYPSEQLGKAKDLLALTQSGVTDVGYVAPSFVSDKMPLSAVGELPGGFTTSCAGATAFWKLVKDGILAKNEFQPSGVRAIVAVVLPPYQLFTKAKLESARNLEGLKIYTAGGAKELAVRKLKAVPIKMATPEVFESLSRGTIDGVLFPYASLFPYNVHTLVKYGTVGESFGSFAATYVISEAKYRQLPANVQKAMTDASEATVTRACALIDKDLDGQIEKAKQSGITLVQFPASERKDVDAAMASVSKEWAEGLDKRGKAGSEVLKAFQDALKTGR
jgi:TRAP-type C4-dicarboxylate transport system substrate-binding protein